MNNIKGPANAGPKTTYRIIAVFIELSCQAFQSVFYKLRIDLAQIPPSGGLDEFDRKWVRNDYGLLALWEMGIKQLRIPLQDLIIPERVKRVTEIRDLGFTFDAYQFGIGKETDIARVLPYSESIGIFMVKSTGMSLMHEMPD